MDIKFRPDGTADCTFTWVFGEGTLVVHSVCTGDAHGTWRVVSGTGSFKHFNAIGTQTFGPLTPTTAVPYSRFERFAGFSTHGEHGDD